jgi:dipeptidyl aminopeptidase/acylaminoacyl peptidase
MKAFVTCAGVAALAIGFGAAAMAAPSKPRLAPLPIDEVLTAPTLAPFSRVTFAPDAHAAAFAVIDRKRAPAHVDKMESYRTGVWWSGLGADIYVVDLAKGGQRNLTEGAANEWLPSWSPDGKSLAFLSDRGDHIAHLWIWDPATGQRRQVGSFAVPLQTEPFQWTYDGHHVVLRLLPEGMSGEDYGKLLLGATPPKLQSTSAAQGTSVAQSTSAAQSASEDSLSGKRSAPSQAQSGASTVRVFSFDPSAKGAAPTTDQVNLDAWLSDLALVDVDTGAVRRLSGRGRFPAFRLSPDRRSLGWIDIKGYEHAGTQQSIGTLIVCDLASGTKRVIADDIRLADYAGDMSFAWSAASDALAWQIGGPVGASDAVFAADLKSGAVRQIAAGETRDDPESAGAGDVYWDDSGKHVYFMRKRAIWRAAVDGSGASVLVPAGKTRLSLIERGNGRAWMPDAHSIVAKTLNETTKRAGFARIDLTTGKVTPFVEEDKRYGGYSVGPQVTPDGKSIAYVAEDSQHAPEWQLASVGGRAPRQISNVAPLFSQYVLGRTSVIEWRGIDGNTLRGALMYPAGYQPGKRYPMVVKVYGGSDVSNSLNEFGFASAPVDNLQLLATRGFAVLYADSRLNVGTPMLDLLKSVLPGVDKAVELGVADPERIGITGHSYGGYSTLSLIVQTNRFKAAVASASIGNLAAAFGALRPDGTNYLMTWAETGQGRMGGNPWNRRERYIENSPVFYLDRVTTPLLIVNGGDDIAPTLADEVFSDLRRLGKRVEYARYAGEDHWEGTWSLANQKDYLTRFVGWFEKYL